MIDGNDFARTLNKAWDTPFTIFGRRDDGLECIAVRVESLSEIWEMTVSLALNLGEEMEDIPAPIIEREDTGYLVIWTEIPWEGNIWEGLGEIDVL